jgi:HIP---CoA ligase
MTALDPLPKTIPHLAEAAAARWRSAPAILEDGEELSFSELWSRSRAAASALIARGIEPGDRVAIWGPNSKEWIIAAIAVMTCGAAVVTLNTRLKGREAGDILRRTQSRLLFTADTFLGIDYRALIAEEELSKLAGTILLDTGFEAFVASGKGAEDAAVDASLAQIGPDTVSDILFTSGTTGSPKGVLMTYGRVLPQAAIWIANTRLGEGDRYLIANPFFHSFGMKVGWVACLIAGAVAVPMPQFDVAQAIEIIERDRITFLPGPPTIFQMLLSELDKKPWDCSSLRGGSTGAATVPPALVERIRNDLGMVDIITAYGMTECVNITTCVPGDSSETIATTCGAAFPGNEVRIVNDEGSELPRGEAGEVHVRGQGVMLGYLDDPAATEEAIDADGWLHTGDVGTMDERGYLRITDRKKDLYISGGFNVYPAEVEKLLGDHPAIAMAAVVGAADDRLGEVGKAFVVLRPGTSASEAELIVWSRAHMANYKVPRSFVLVEDLPRNASGKVLKTELRGGTPGSLPVII